MCKTEVGIELLGCPIGSDLFVKNIVSKRIEKIRKTIDAVKDIGDSQIETILLR
jgi:hypothetical protein